MKLRRQPKERPCVEQFSDDASDDLNARDVSTQTDASSVLIEKELTAAAERIAALKLKVKCLKQDPGAQKFRLCDIVHYDVEVAFYTGFPNDVQISKFRFPNDIQSSVQSARCKKCLLYKVLAANSCITVHKQLLSPDTMDPNLQHFLILKWKQEKERLRFLLDLFEQNGTQQQ